MMKIEEYLESNHAESIRVDAFSNNPISLRMYSKLGYKKKQAKQLGGRDCFIYWKRCYKELACPVARTFGPVPVTWQAWRFFRQSITKQRFI